MERLLKSFAAMRFLLARLRPTPEPQMCGWCLKSDGHADGSACSNDPAMAVVAALDADGRLVDWNYTDQHNVGVHTRLWRADGWSVVNIPLGSISTLPGSPSARRYT